MEIAKMKVKLDRGAYPPERAHPTDAGLDLRAKYGGYVPPHGSLVCSTGVHIQLPEHTAGLLVSKSGLNVIYDITSTGLIDEGYRGEILVKLYNHGDTEYTVYPGDKISQLVIIPVCYDDIEAVESLDDDTERGEGGFGSTGR